MPFDKPTKLPRWADVPGIGADGQAHVAEPPEGRKDDGWQWKEKPPRQWFNWLLNLTYEWLGWISQWIDNVNSSDIVNDSSVAGTDVTEALDTLEGDILQIAGSSGMISCKVTTTYAETEQPFNISYRRLHMQTPSSYSTSLIAFSISDRRRWFI